MTDYTFAAYITDIKDGVFIGKPKLKEMYDGAFLFNIQNYGESFLDNEAVREIEEEYSYAQ